MEPSTIRYEFFRTPITVLKIMQLWQETKTKNGIFIKIWTYFRVTFSIWSMLPNLIPILFDFLCLLNEGGDGIQEALVPGLAWLCILGHHYLALCFLSNRELIKNTMDKIYEMKRFRPIKELKERDQQAMFYTKIMLIYSTLGSTAYTMMPILPFAIEHCKATASKSLIENRIPCIFPCRLRVPFLTNLDDETVYYIYVVLCIHQVYVIFSVAYIFITLTMLLWSIVLQLTHHFKALRKMISQIDSEGGNHDLLIQCINYHHAIIDLANYLNEAFGSQMFMFITLPSIAISMLGYHLIDASLVDAIRYGMHLLGWICLLYLVSFGGQVLMEESEGVAETAYGIKWYDYDIKLQKDLQMLIIRAQKPARLNAISYGFLTKAAFLKVMSSAYSYFTLLLRLKMNNRK